MRFAAWLKFYCRHKTWAVVVDADTGALWLRCANCGREVD